MSSSKYLTKSQNLKIFSVLTHKTRGKWKPLSQEAENQEYLVFFAYKLLPSLNQAIISAHMYYVWDQNHRLLRHANSRSFVLSMHIIHKHKYAACQINMKNKALKIPRDQNALQPQVTLNSEKTLLIANVLIVLELIESNNVTCFSDTPRTAGNPNWGEKNVKTM